MDEKRPKSPLLLKEDATARTISLVMIKNPSDQNYDRFYRDVGRIQWLSVGYGGREDGDLLIFSFEQEEYNCALRYLRNFEWKDRCEVCAGTGEKP